MTLNKPLMKPFWFGCWVVTLTLGWLLPNHHAPWLSFHADAWVALAMLLAAAAAIWRSSQSVAWHHITVLVALLMGLPWVQYATGLVQSAGVAWLYSTFLLGLLLALLVGAHWEATNPGRLADGLFLAVGLAAIVSVGLQLQQWLELDGLWLLNLRASVLRPSANLGQPNQLATLLLWGVLAAAWGVARGRINGWPAVLMAAYLLFGIALTGSRTAWLGVALLVGAVWLWRHLWESKRMPWVVTGLSVYFGVSVVGVGWLSQTSNAGTDLPAALEGVTRMSGEIRPLAWAAFIDAAWQKPWGGYGWGQVALAQMAVATEHPNLSFVFSYSHNLLLDLVLWCGIPLGLLVFISLFVWLLQRMRAAKDACDVVLLLFLLVVGNHALLELPLYFGYFLLPVGLVMGMLNTRLSAPVLFSVRRSTLIVMWLLAATLLALIIRDYARVESSYRTLRMEWDGIETTESVAPPDVLLLTQWHDYIRSARIEPRSSLAEADLEGMRYAIVVSPNLLIFYKLASSLALNQQPDAAGAWLQRMCKVTSAVNCHRLQKVWASQASRYPDMAAVVWPSEQAD